jgi:peptidoglycan/LPS O-acetylase OafA/YrhL
MGRKFLPPEQADSWGEYHARLEMEADARVDPWRPLWWSLGGLLFGSVLIFCAYAVQDHHWWLWLAMCATLAITGVMAVRAVDRADRDRARAAELAQLEAAWLDHLDRRSPTI